MKGRQWRYVSLRSQAQDLFGEIIAAKGEKDETYLAALEYIRRNCREEGIDAALHLGQGHDRQFDALLFCDAKGVGQQIAAQAGKTSFGLWRSEVNSIGYPIITAPIGIDDKGIPKSKSIQNSAWREADLVKWASAIEDAIMSSKGWRPLPYYDNALAKNIPIEN